MNKQKVNVPGNILGTLHTYTFSVCFVRQRKNTSHKMIITNVKSDRLLVQYGTIALVQCGTMWYNHK